MNQTLDVQSFGLRAANVLHNPAVALLYEQALEEGAQLTSSGALAALSGEKTGRCPRDKRIVDEPSVHDDVWWGAINIPLPEASYARVRQRAFEFLNTRRRLYVIDGFAGWDPKYRLKIRVLCARAYHALFMHNMLIRPTPDETLEFGEPDFTILNAGQQTADPTVPGVTSDACVAISFERGEMTILGTQYAGEMKKGIFTIMHYLMPKQGVLSLHCAANEGLQGDVSLFFGLSGTGKTTLSTDSHRRLIGDDEHCWSDDGVFNIEGGCYAKCIGLSSVREPEIYQAIRFGTVLENTVVDPESRAVDFQDGSLTDNTRAAYPIEFIDGAKIPCVGGHPRNIIMLTCDASGVLPPISRLTPEQAMYHFVSGYTAKVAGTEVGVSEPEATFSACFGAAFLVWHPTRYAEMLAEKLRTHDAQAWLVNTGWQGGGPGLGARIPLQYTRAMIDAIHAGVLRDMATVEDPVFGLHVPTKVPRVPDHVLQPRLAWKDPAAYDQAAQRLAALYERNFRQYANAASEATKAAGPRVAPGK